jgi:molybdenum cofactor biosynthesis protein A
MMLGYPISKLPTGSAWKFHSGYERMASILRSGHGRIRTRQQHATSAMTDLDEDYNTPTSTPSQVVVHSTSPTTRPRLKALREQLRHAAVPKSLLKKTATLTNKTASATKTNIHWRELLDRSHEAQPVKTSTTTEAELEGVKLHPIAASKVLTDRFGRHHNYLRISLAERCNLRCTYCMPPEGVPLQPQSHLLQTPEILSLARHFYNHGVNKIRLTGGEPTLRKDLIDVLTGLKAIGSVDQSGRGGGGLQELALTTNGVTLAKNLDAYINAGLNRVNISLDTLIPDKFATLTRRPAAYWERVWESIEAACSKAPEELVTKINVVVMKGINDHEVADFCALQTRFPNLHIRFIEYMPFSENGWNMDGWVPYRDLLQHLEKQDDVQLVKLPEVDPNDTTKWYTTLENSNEMKVNGSGTTAKNKGIGQIGFITSMSQPFCGTCNRLRLTSDGQIKVCLFDGNSTISLRDAIREGANAQDLDRLIQHALGKKHFSLGGHTSPEHILQDSDRNRPMTLIGG